MEKQAGEVLQENVLAGVRLECPQLIREMLLSSGGEHYSSTKTAGTEQAIGGAAGALFGRFATGSLQKSQLGGGGIYYVAVGPSKLAFFSVKRGLIKNSLGELIVEYPRSDLQSLDIKKGIMPKAHFVFKDGTGFVLMCARALKGKLKKVKQALETV